MRRKYLGKTLAVIGLVLLLSSVFTWIIGLPLMAMAKIGLALAFFVVYGVTNFGDLGDTASSRGTFFMAVSAISTAVLLALLVIVNWMAAKSPKTWDLTKNQIHTLSDDTTKTLAGLKDSVTATAFYKSGEPQFEALKELFEKYKKQSDKFVFEFVDPIKDPIKVQQFGIKESGPRVVVKLGNTEARFQEITEEQLTNAIVKVTHSSTKKIYFTTGHGEADVDDTGVQGYSEVKKRMENEGLKADKLNLAGVAEIPQDAQVVVVAGPEKAFQPNEVETLKKFLAAGGKAFIMVEPQMESGLEELLKEFSVEAENSVVVDPISRLFGASELIPVVQQYNDSSPIVKDFKLNTAFPTARPLAVLHGTPSSANAQPLALSMPSAWGETNPNGKVQRDENEKGGPFPLVVTVTQNTASASPKRSDEARLVVSGDRDFASNKFRTFVGNEDFFLNSINWLAEQSERITIRPRTRDASRLYLTDTQKASIFFLTIDVLPVMLLAVGLTVWMVRRSK